MGVMSYQAGGEEPRLYGGQDVPADGPMQASCP